MEQFFLIGIVTCLFNFQTSLSQATDFRHEDQFPPQIIRNGKSEILDNLEPFKILNTKLSPDPSFPTPSVGLIPGGDSIELAYVQHFLSPDMIQKLINVCDSRKGWTSSPQTHNLHGQGSTTVKNTRTSRSCPFIWPQLYLEHMDILSTYPDKVRSARLKEEVELAWNVTQHVAALLDVKEEHVEPFQLLKYESGEFYKQHHDHGSYYGEDTEQRPWTFLLYLSDIPSCYDSNGVAYDNGGGYTYFNNLDISVVPRMGDGILWRNIDEHTGNVLEDALHEARPLSNDDHFVKYAMNVWISQEKVMEHIEVGAYRTHF